MMPMLDPLPLDERLETAAQLVLRARAFYDLWRFFEGAETRPAIINTMRLYSEFFRFDPHAHFVSFVVHVAALFDKRSDSINLPALANELAALG
jgi:AbiU2